MNRVLNILLAGLLLALGAVSATAEVKPQSGIILYAQMPDGTISRVLLDANGNILTTLDQSGPGTTNGVNLRQSPRASYRAVVTGYGAYATPTDLAGICGSATKTVYVTAFLSSAHSTAAAQMVLSWIKRSAADTGGTPAVATAMPLDSADAAATATVTSYTGAPSTGAAVGTFYTAEYTTSAPTTTNGFNGMSATTSPPLATAAALQQPLTLHGTAECVYVNFGGAALPSGFANGVIIIEWAEV